MGWLVESKRVEICSWLAQEAVEEDRFSYEESQLYSSEAPQRRLAGVRVPPTKPHNVLITVMYDSNLKQNLIRKIYVKMTSLRHRWRQTV